MKFTISTNDFTPGEPVRVGNVYSVKGGRGLRYKHMQVLVAMSEPLEYQGIMCYFLVITKEGQPCGVNSYALHYVQDLQPIAFCSGLEDMDLTVGSL